MAAVARTPGTARSPFPGGAVCLLDTGHPSQLLLGEREGVRERGGWRGGEEGGRRGGGRTLLMVSGRRLLQRSFFSITW